MKLKQAIQIEYELDRGARPSGYAYFSLELLPAKDKASALSVAIHPTDFEIAIKQTSTGTDMVSFINQYLSSFIEMGVSGLKRGIEEALQSAFDLPIVGVVVYIKKIGVDTVYSTEGAFCSASRIVLMEKLQEVHGQGLLF